MLGKNRNWMITGLLPAVVLGLAFGCSGGGGTEPVDNNEVDPGYLSGAITVAGAPLADLDDPETVGDLDSDKWSAWLIDTTEDVDTIAIDPDGLTLTPTTVTTPGTYVLSIDLLPAVDMSGDGSTVTPVTVSLPLTIESTVETVVTVAVEFTKDLSMTTSQTTRQAGDYRVLLHYTVSGPETLDELIELQWLNQTLRSDSDGDGSLDNEPDYLDSNRDFLSDGLQERLEQQGHGPQDHHFEGEILLINLEMRNLRVDNQMFRTDEMTRAEFQGRRIPLTELTTGTMVRITYYQGNGQGGTQGGNSPTNYARLIEVLE